MEDHLRSHGNGPGLSARLRQTRRLLRAEGPSGVAARFVRRASEWASPPGHAPLLVDLEDVRRAAEVTSRGRGLPGPLDAQPGEPLTVAWVCSPPSAGSGGHTTMFRLVSSLEQAGHTCVLYLYDRHSWPLERHRETIRSWWPTVQAEVRDVADGIQDAHAIFATGWETAYPVLASNARGARFYLVQDLESSFYPAGTESLLAEATYRFGFHGVTAGGWLAQVLRRDYGMPADHFDFGRDRSYDLDRTDGAPERTSVCFFSRPDTPRRAFRLGVAAMELFAARHPETDIHLFGGRAKRLPFQATDHGPLRPDQLNDLYNRCVAGLVLSATNVSLVPHEMLAAGCLPVVNDAEHNRIVLNNPQVVYSPATPFDLSNALCGLIERNVAQRAAAAKAAANSVAGQSWDGAGVAVEQVVRRVVGSPIATGASAA